MDDKFTLGIFQTAIKTSSGKVAKAENEDNFERLIVETAARGAQIICLQELFHAPYFCTVESHDFFELAEGVHGPLISRFSNVAKKLGVVLVLPFFERRAAGVYHNSAAVIDADGALLGVYRKMHIPDDPLFLEKFYFAPGDEDPGYQVFKTRFAHVGVLICWDQWYPEASRLTALKGAEVLFYPTAIGWHPKEKQEFGESQRQAWQTVQRAHAIANGIYVASPNRVGFEETPGTDGLEFFGASFISDPFGRLLVEAGTEGDEILTATCSRKHLETTRQHWPFLRDRRIDSYGDIKKRWID